MHAGREKKLKPKSKRGPVRPEELAEELGPAVSKWLKKSGRNKHDAEAEDSDGEVEAGARQRRAGGSSAPSSLVESVFVNWEELLASRETLKRRLVTIAAVHGWESRSSRKSFFMGGIEPNALLSSIRKEVRTLDAAAELCGKVDLLLELQQRRAELEALSEERDRLAEDVLQLREDNFEARDQLAGQTDELEKLRLVSRGAEGRTDTLAGAERAAQPPSSQRASAASASAGAETFQLTLGRGQRAEGRRVVQAIEQLKLPDETTMGSYAAREPNRRLSACE